MKHMPQTLQTLKTKERIQMWDRKLQTKNTPVFLYCEVCPMLGRRSNLSAEHETKAEPRQISKGHLSPSQKHFRIERLDLHLKMQLREKLLPKHCTHKKAVSKNSLGMQSL